MMRLRAVWDYVRGTYWALPSAMAVAAIVLSFGMIQVDETVTPTFLDRLAWVYTGGPDGARAVLSTIAGSMITVAGVTFSITIVALTLASQQFGPRLLRNFLRDLGNQIVLGTFVSTFLYCLLVLRTIRGTDDTEFVPHLAVTLGVVLAMLSLGVLIFFIHHVATSIQASQIIAKVASELDAAAKDLFPEQLGQGVCAEEADAAAVGLGAGERRTIGAATAGYVQMIDAERLMRVARDRDVSIRLHIKPGAFVRADSDLMTVCAASFAPDWTSAPFRGAVIVGAERTGTQDVAFFIDQLVELAVRALSPGINDPATARNCIDRLEQALCDLASRRFPSGARYDADHTLRIIASPVTFASLVESAFAEVGRHATRSVAVSCRVLDALDSVSACVRREGDRRRLLDEAGAIADQARRMDLSRRDRDAIMGRYDALLATLNGVEGRSRSGAAPDG